jgi:hypothetical protein
MSKESLRVISLAIPNLLFHQNKTLQHSILNLKHSILKYKYISLQSKPSCKPSS